jgi:hypothetical protein
MIDETDHLPMNIEPFALDIRRWVASGLEEVGEARNHSCWSGTLGIERICWGKSFVGLDYGLA